MMKNNDIECARQQNRRAYLLELLNGTLVNTTALVDQICENCERKWTRRPSAVGGEVGYE